jgi:hypothetical protein
MDVPSTIRVREVAQMLANWRRLGSRGGTPAKTGTIRQAPV